MKKSFVIGWILLGVLIFVKPLKVNALEIWQVKKDALIVLMDISSSMNQSVCLGKKNEIEKRMLSAFIKAIPRPGVKKLKASLCLFGGEPSAIKHCLQVLYPLSRFNRQEYLKAISQVSKGAGPTPLGNALINMQSFFDNARGQIALLILSDGLQNGIRDAIKVTQNLKQKYGNKVCISAILIGNSSQGEETLRKIVKTAKCGYFIRASELESNSRLQDYVFKVLDIKKIVLKPAPIKPDRCNLASKSFIIYFDSAKYEVNPKFYNFLDKIGNYLSQCPTKRALICGHTDSIGTKCYNLKLSLKRAEAVKQYLINRYKIDPQRIQVIGYGASKPKASNQTPEGRAQNRRVEIYIQ